VPKGNRLAPGQPRDVGRQHRLVRQVGVLDQYGYDPDARRQSLDDLPTNPVVSDVAPEDLGPPGTDQDQKDFALAKPRDDLMNEVVASLNRPRSQEDLVRPEAFAQLAMKQSRVAGILLDPVVDKHNRHVNTFRTCLVIWRMSGQLAVR
jgi:hypothetical protein